MNTTTEVTSPALPVNTAAAIFAVGQRVRVIGWDNKEATITRVPQAEHYTGDYGVELQFRAGGFTHHFFSNQITPA